MDATSRLQIPVIGSIARGDQRLNCSMRGSVARRWIVTFTLGTATSIWASTVLLFGLVLTLTVAYVRSSAPPCLRWHKGNADFSPCPPAFFFSQRELAATVCLAVCWQFEGADVMLFWPMNVCHIWIRGLPARALCCIQRPFACASARGAQSGHPSSVWNGRHVAGAAYLRIRVLRGGRHVLSVPCVQAETAAPRPLSRNESLCFSWHRASMFRNMLQCFETCVVVCVRRRLRPCLGICGRASHRMLMCGAMLTVRSAVGWTTAASILNVATAFVASGLGSGEPWTAEGWGCLMLGVVRHPLPPTQY